MVDMGAIAGALQAIKTAKDLAQAMIGLRDAKAIEAKRLEFQSTLIEAQERILAAQEERAELLNRVRTLEEEIAGFKAWGAERERYELKQIAPGAFAYMPKPAVRGSEPPHWLCATCFENRRKAFLQKQAQIARDAIYKCPTCSGAVHVPLGTSPGKESG